MFSDEGTMAIQISSINLISVLHKGADSPIYSLGRRYQWNLKSMCKFSPVNSPLQENIQNFNATQQFENSVSLKNTCKFQGDIQIKCSVILEKNWLDLSISR